MRLVRRQPRVRVHIAREVPPVRADAPAHTLVARHVRRVLVLRRRRHRRARRRRERNVELLLVDLANAGTTMWSASLIGIALLVLAASHLAPVPPKEERAAAGPDGDAKAKG